MCECVQICLHGPERRKLPHPLRCRAHPRTAGGVQRERCSADDPKCGGTYTLIHKCTSLCMAYVDVYSYAPIHTGALGERAAAVRGLHEERGVREADSSAYRVIAGTLGMSNVCVGVCGGACLVFVVWSVTRIVNTYHLPIPCTHNHSHSHTRSSSTPTRSCWH
jgi:hypothetical protein